MRIHASVVAFAALALAACQDATPTGAVGRELELSGRTDKQSEVLVAGATSAAGIMPLAIDGNIFGNGVAQCSAYGGTGSTATKVGGADDAQVAGYRFTVGGGDRTLSFAPIAGTNPTTAITAVLVKGGDAYSVYDYSPPNSSNALAITNDAGLTSPVNNGGNIPQISHYVVCTTPVTITLTKSFVAVLDEHMNEVQPHMMDGVPMYEFPTSTNTLWIKYRIDYVGTGMLTDNMAQACSDLNDYYSGWGSGFYCTTAGFIGHESVNMPPTVQVSGSGSMYIILDVTNYAGCGDRPFINTATLTPTGGSPVTATAQPVWLWTPNCG